MLQYIGHSQLLTQPPTSARSITPPFHAQPQLHLSIAPTSTNPDQHL
ncbi:hypothetical protein NHJ13734_004360 [Beauveria thailandica]